VAEFAKYEPRDAGAEAGARARLADLGVRPAERGDIARLAPIAAEREGTSVEEAAASLARFLDEATGGRALLLIAESAGAAVGFAKAAYFAPPPGSPANTAPEGWYLSGVVVSPAVRRRGVGAALTAARLEWLAARDVSRVYYFANARNRTSIDLHAAFGFVEVTRDFTHPHAQFEGGVGVLFARDGRGAAT
jgi:GNAT superfamily N-acetyltransferase